MRTALNDNIHIKSSKKVYEVSYSNKNVEQLVNQIYNKDDFIFIDKNVYNLSVDTFKNIKNILLFDAIEDNKNIENVLKLIDSLYNLKFNRKHKLLVIGGGITQDVGGFAAAIYKRGINWIFIPTTILSMTDSCIGGKVSINRESKNMLGMFVAPSKIFILCVFIYESKYL
jgi:3-dehydroquinate synthase